MALLVIWPCLVHMERLKTGLENQPWFPDTAVQEDFFQYAKSMALVFLALWMAAALTDRILLGRMGRLPLRRTWPLLLYGGLAAASSLCSRYPDFCFTAVTEQCETLWVILAYLVVFAYFYHTVRYGNGEALLVRYLLAGAGVQSAIGISQLLGCDFWSTAAGRFLILLGRDTAGLEFAFAEKEGNQVYLSFYNPNYAAVYLALVLPVAIYALRYLEKRWERASVSVLILALLACLWGTGSKAGILTIVILALAAGFFLISGWRKRILLALAFLLGAASYMAVSLLLPGDSFGERVFHNILPEEKHYSLQSVDPGLDQVEITFSGKTYVLRLDSEGGRTWFSVLNQKGKTVPLDYDEETGRFSIASKNYQLEFSAWKDGEESHIMMYRLGIPWEFVKKDADSPYEYVTLFGKTDVPVNAPYAFGKGYERAFSDRVYLWSRTVPLLPDYLLLGSGPDTFALVFPQNDYVTRANIGIDMMTQVITRPHSFYLQTAVQTGVLSLEALLLFFIRFLYGGSRLVRAKIGRENGLLAALLLSVAGYLIMGISNDSLVVTAPIFWALLGAGFGIAEKNSCVLTGKNCVPGGKKTRAWTGKNRFIGGKKNRAPAGKNRVFGGEK